MRKDKIFALFALILASWMSLTYFLYFHRPSTVDDSARRKALERQMAEFKHKLDAQVEINEALLKEIGQLKSSDRKDRENSVSDKDKEEFKDFDEETGQRHREDDPPSLKPEDKIAVLMFACNRPTVSKALDSLLAVRSDPERFPIIVSQVHISLNCLKIMFVLIQMDFLHTLTLTGLWRRSY